jgi:agmatine deiminase
MNRRKFIRNSAYISAIIVTSGNLVIANENSELQEQWHMPEESEPHKRTWMGFVSETTIWGRRLAPQVKKDLALIANTIVEFEPVTMLVQEKDLALAKRLLKPQVELVVCPLNDLWLRDTAPTFVISELGKKAAVNLNFNGWGEKQKFNHDSKVADFIAKKSGVVSLLTDLTLEGGCVEVDGNGTAIITESCVLNDNRNPGINKAEFEDQLMPLLGLEKIIWLPGIKDQDITDGHTDFYARFVRQGCVVVGLENDKSIADYDITREHLKILSSAKDANGHDLHIEVLEAPHDVKVHPDEEQDFAAGYIGYYVCNGAVIAQKFGDKDMDLKSKNTLSKLFPNREIIQLEVNAIASGGGSIHCATQQEPLSKSILSDL